MFFMLVYFSNVMQSGHVLGLMLAQLGLLLVSYRVVLGTLRALLGPPDPPWEHLGAVLGPIMESCSSIRDHLRTIWRPSGGNL